ncbi:MAG: GNAT family N-acetyltransferase [Gemmatimonadota bacterium]
MAMRAAFTIRRAMPDDAGMLSVFGGRVFREFFGPDNTPADIIAHVAATYSPEIQRRELLDPEMCTFVAVSGEEPIGYAHLRKARAPGDSSAESPIELERFYVDGAWHGKGVAQALMEESVTHMAAKGADAIWLSVWERNSRAIAFYGKMGFIQSGRKFFWVGSDRQNDYIMSRALQKAVSI